MSSPVKLSPIAARYTCDGADISPQLHWSGVPADTKEIELYLFNFLPVHGKLVASWAVAGLSPRLHGLPTGSLPPGAILGRNSNGHIGYSLCPARGKEVRLAFLMYALPEKVPVKAGFDAEALRAKSLHIAKSAGLLGVGYKRR